jgi:hypothetical protein
MKKNYLILLTAGVLIAVIVISAKRKSPVPVDIIKPGDKGNEIYGLQSALTSITGLRFANMGAYDNDTLNAVKGYMEGSNALYDYERGWVDKNFASDLFLIQSRVRKK